jgi:hypothetical protein
VLTWSNPAAQQTATRKDGPPSGREPVQALKALEVLCKGTTDEMANGHVPIAVDRGVQPERRA